MIYYTILKEWTNELYRRESCQEAKPLTLEIHRPWADVGLRLGNS